MARRRDRYSFWADIDPVFQKLADAFHDLNAQLEAVKLPLLLGRSSF